MMSNMGIHAAVVRAIRKVRPDRVHEDGTVKISRRTIIELKMRVRAML